MKANPTTPTAGEAVAPLTVLELSYDALQVIMPLKKREAEIRQELEENLKAQSDALLKAGYSAQALARSRRPPAPNIKGRICDAIKNAGKDGIFVKQIAEQTQLDRQTVDRWLFSASAKNVKEIKKTGVAHYSWQEVPAGNPGRKQGAGKLAHARA